MNLFLKGNSYPVVSIGKFSSQLYVITQSRRVINSQCLFQRLNLSRVILRTNTYKAENSYYAPRRVVRAKSNEMYSISVRVSKNEVYVTLKIKEYITSVIYKSKLI